ncbi:FlgO family outer membrane protein [Campylobacterota bacterium DY0563]|uniref:FlgO family outer membrane protein n=1 Tax=Halarcobacter sp. TaxID=2321133 RepID=UPI0029F50CA5|nr:FlgO family outer membrane protein [Halarcobacter sp.]
MYKTFAKSCLVAATVSLFLGCSVKSPLLQSYSDNSVDKENQKVQVTKQHIEVANDMQQNVTTQYTLEATINSLAAQMMQNQKMSTNKPILITSFVRLDNFKKTTEFGRIVSESLINEMSNRGFNIIEYRGQMAVSINERGEYFISRNPHKLKEKIPNTYVVVGTYSRQYGKIMLNARVMDNITGKIISSARSTFQHNRKNDCILFKDCKPARTINIIEEK